MGAHTSFCSWTGSITIDGQSVPLQKEFAQQALQLSQHLGTSERYAASLLQAGMAGRARWGRTAIEVSCLLFYREKLALLACLKDLLSGLLTARAEDEPQMALIGQVETFLDKLVATELSAPSKTSFVKRLVNEIDATVSQTAQLEQRLHRAPGQNTDSALGDDLLLESISFVKQQTRDLGHVLYLLSACNLLRSSDVHVLVDWLKASAPARFSSHTIYILTALLASLAERSHLLADTAFVKNMTGAVEAPWQTEPIRCAVALQWSLCMVQLLKTGSYSNSELRSQEEKIQTLVTTAIRGGVFAFLSLNVLEFKHKQREDEVWNADEEESNSNGQERSDIDAEFQEYILDQLLSLSLGISTVMLPVLRKLQREEEDAAFASSRSRATEPVEQRHDLMQFFDLIAIICHGRPDAGLAFWTGDDGRTTRFLLWAIDARQAGHQRSLLHMLAAMATGGESALQAHNLLSSADGRLVSWDRLFEWLQYYLDLFSAKGSSSARKIPEEEEALLLAFIHLLRNVVFYSATARAALYENASYLAIRRIFAMCIGQVDLRLKAALFDTLAAFAKPDHSHSAHIHADLWALLNSTDVLGTGQIAMRTPLQISTSGALYALEHTETAERNYASTCSLVNFLAVLLPGQIGAVDDYVLFVVEKVFLQAATREYNRLSDRWKVTSACLGFLQKCLDGFRVEELLTGSKVEPQLAAHAGFLIAKQLFTGSPLTKELFTILSTGFETLNAARTPLLTTCIKQALKTARRAFEVQDLFLQVLLPGLAESNQDSSRIGSLARYAPLDQQLLHSHQTVVEIALYINSTSDAVALLSTQVLGQIASSQSFAALDRFTTAGGRRHMSRLVGLLEMTEETARMRSGYLERLGSAETVSIEDESEDDGRQISIRLAILDLLIKHVSSKPPSISHLLLGYDISTTSQAIPDPDAAGTSPGVLHGILSLLNVQDNSFQTLITQNPLVAERCFHLLVKLCNEPWSSASTLRYLRTREDFCATRLAALPFAPTARADGQGDAVYSTGLRVPTTIGAAVASLRMKADLLSLVALELHTLTSGDMLHLATPMLNLLLDAEEDVGVRLLDLLSSFDFEWHDSRDTQSLSLDILASLDLGFAKRVDAATGDREYDLSKGAALLNVARIELQNKGALRDPTQQQLFEKEAGSVLRWFASQNAQRAVLVGRRAALRSWKHCLDIILTRCSSLLRGEDRLGVLFDLLAALLPRITSGSDASSIDLFTGSILALITALRARPEDQYDTLPADRLLATLRSLVAAIIQPGTSALARGNLYSALISFLQLLRHSAHIGDDGSDDNASVSALSVAPSGLQGSSAVFLRSRSVLLEKAEKLIVVVARDALDAADIWKTVAFTLLDRLHSLESSRSRPSKMLSVLQKNGFLKSMVGALRDLDLPLQDALRPDPSSLNAIYVYEAIMSFFIRLGGDRAGAEALVEARALEHLASSDFLASLPEGGVSAMEADTFLPAARERHASLMSPALEFAAALFAHASTAARPIISLLNAHQDAFSHVLRSVQSDIVTLSQVRQASLLIALLGLRAEANDGGAANEMVSFRKDVLAVAALFLTTDGWRRRILPGNDLEREASARINARDGLSAFDLRAAETVEQLQKALLVYLESSTQGHGRMLRPVLTAALAPQQVNDYRSTPLPSIGLLLTATEQQIDFIAGKVAALDRILQASQSTDQISEDDWDEVSLEKSFIPLRIQILTSFRISSDRPGRSGVSIRGCARRSAEPCLTASCPGHARIWQASQRGAHHGHARDLARLALPPL